MAALSQWESRAALTRDVVRDALLCAASVLTRRTRRLTGETRDLRRNGLRGGWALPLTAVLLTAVVLTACEGSVPLASDCVPLGRLCRIEEKVGSGTADSAPDEELASVSGGSEASGDPGASGQDELDEMDASAAGRAGSGEVSDEDSASRGARDAGVVDASLDGSNPAEREISDADGAPPLSNPSFERDDGNEGRAAISFPTGVYTDSPIDPWIACRAEAWTAPWADLRDPTLLVLPPTGDPDPEERLEPTEGDAVLEAGFRSGSSSGTELVQELDEALDPERVYAWLIDLAAVSAVDESVYLELRSSAEPYCLSGRFAYESLARSQPLRVADGWTTVCLSFRPSEAHQHITLVPRNTSTIATDNDRLFLDNLRAAPGGVCPEETPPYDPDATP